MGVGGCCLTQFARRLSVLLPRRAGFFFFFFPFSFLNNLLAARRFNWSHFCQTRQAATHLGIIQGAPADTGTRPPLHRPHRRTDSDELPGNRLISCEHCRPPRCQGWLVPPSQLGIKGLMSVRFSQPRFHKKKKTTWCTSPSGCPAHLPSSSSSSFHSVEQERRHYRNPSFSPVVSSIMGRGLGSHWCAQVKADSSSKSKKVQDVKCTWVII